MRVKSPLLVHRECRCDIETAREEQRDSEMAREEQRESKTAREESEEEQAEKVVCGLYGQGSKVHLYF